jgi:7-cyano-7-deazaguanine synthase in queuosine biosynthesis
MKILCSPDPARIDHKQGVAFSIYEKPKHHSVRHLAYDLHIKIRRSGIKPKNRTWDFFSIAMAIAAADFACLRKNSPDGWTRQIELEVAVLDPFFWETQKKDLESALAFLTGDIWRVQFVSGGASPPIPTRQARRHMDGDCVCLLSGGADSLVGAIDAVNAGKQPVLVSQISRGDREKQVRFANALGATLSHLQLPKPAKGPERSQRARSIVFLAYGLIAAMHLSEKDGDNRKTLLVPENGFISLNVPLTPLRIGSLSTRTTHPFFFKKIQTIFDACEFPVQIDNPYQFNTKGEMFAICSDQGLLRQLAHQSTSCGRFGTYKLSHCGRCVPCLIRRAAFVRWGIDDATQYHPWSKSGFLSFDDVQAALYATHRVKNEGVISWAGNAISSAQLGPTQDYLDLLHRGIEEIEALFQNLGIR